MDTKKNVAIDNLINQKLLLKLVNSVDISELNFPVRTDCLLRGVGIDTIGKLCNKTKLDLLSEETLHPVAIRHAENKLRQIGLNLKPLGFPIATSKDWKRLPVADVSISFDLELQLLDEQYNKLKRGNIPHNMDEWFVYYERGVLHFCRSTGLCIFTVELDEIFHKHHIKTYVYNLDNIKTWKEDAPERVKIVLDKYSR